MLLKLILTISSLLSIAQAGLITQANTYTIATPLTKHYQQEYHSAVPAVAVTQQNVVRSFDGTISSYSKAIDTPYASVRKQDTRFNNNVYTPSLTKTVSFASPASQLKSIYAAPAPTAATFYAQNALPIQYSQPLKVVSSTGYSPVEPAFTKTIVTQVAAPGFATVDHVPTVTSYTHGAPIVSGYGSTQSVLYSPAEKVSHISFDGFGTHWGI